MHNKNMSFEIDPFLRHNDVGLSKIDPSVSNDKWEEAMKDMPTFSEHMRNVENANGKKNNAFHYATKDYEYEEKMNAISICKSGDRIKTDICSTNAFRLDNDPTKNEEKILKNKDFGHSKHN